MNPNQMNYFNALVQQSDFRDEARRARQAEEAAERPVETRASRGETGGHDHHILGFLGLALPGRR
jgi:hypothetical protein